VAKSQAPFAAILGCADSCVPAEIVFDCGLGDLFVCRVAGNLATSEEIGSLNSARWC
jgi:carbonic anhydrase